MDCRSKFLQTLSTLTWILPLLTILSSDIMAQSYCDAGADNGAQESIGRVQLGTIDQQSSGTTGYEDFTSVSTSLLAGSTYPCTISINTPFNEDQVLIWLDTNHDGDFADAGETLYTSSIGPGPFITDLTIPAGSLTGTTRMRIRVHATGSGDQPNSSPCGMSGYGEVEDYTISIGSSNCNDFVTLSSPTHDISSGTHLIEANQMVTATNKITGGTVMHDGGVSVQLDPHFEVGLGATYTIKIDGCNGN